MANNNMITTWKTLTYLGVLPFILFLLFEPYLALYLKQSSLVSSKQAFIFYSSAILSFLSGTLWQKSKQNNNTCIINVLSNVLCLYAFGCLFLPIYFAITALSIGYLLLLLAEFIYLPRVKTDDNDTYFITRVSVTFVVVALHIVALFIWHDTRS